MVEVELLGEIYEIDEEQKAELEKLLKDIKEGNGKKQIYLLEDYSHLPTIIQIIIGGVIWDLSKHLFRTYRDMIMDIIKRN